MQITITVPDNLPTNFIWNMITKPMYWNADKNRKLIEERGISFEEIIFSLQNGGLIDDIRHPNTENYPH